MKVAVIGLGVGRHHVGALKNLPDQFDVVAVCDLDMARAQAAASQHGIARVAASLDDLCAMDDVDVIDLCTPSHLHVAQVQQALDAGKHVICEKPVAGSLQEMDLLMRAEQASGKRVMPIFQRRFGAGLQRLKFLQRQGMAGRAYLSTIETHWRRGPAYYATWHGKWKTELGGVLVTLAIHAHDILQYVIGPARTVYAHLATLVNPIETEDTAAISVQMADRSLAALSATTGSSAQMTRTRFCFSGLSAESSTGAYNSDCDPWVFVGDTAEASAKIEEALHSFVPLPEGFEGQFHRYHQAMQQGGELPVTLADARASVELITAIYHSAETHLPVTLPIGADHPKYGSWLPRRV